MTTQRKWALAAAALAVGVALAFVILVWPPGAPSEPSYAGHTLTEWLLWELYLTQDPPARPPEAMRHIGTNAVPCLLRWIAEADSSTLKSRIEDWVAVHLKRSNAQDDPAHWTASRLRGFRAVAAPSAFQALGPDAVAAIPELERMANSPGKFRVFGSVYSLNAIGAKALPALERIARNTNSPGRRMAADVLSAPKSEPRRTG